jgi:hypothetical protein
MKKEYGPLSRSRKFTKVSLEAIMSNSITLLALTISISSFWITDVAAVSDNFSQTKFISNRDTPRSTLPISFWQSTQSTTWASSIEI